MPPSIPSNLGNKVTTRTTSWQDLVEKAWGSEFRAPDHDIYRFGGGARNYDSTDKGLTGLYGVHGDNLIYLNNQYPDMRDGILVNADGVTPGGAQNNGFGSFVDIGADSLVTSAASSGGAVVETDPQWANVRLLLRGDNPLVVDQSSFAATNILAQSNANLGPIPAYALPAPQGASLAYQPVAGRLTTGGLNFDNALFAWLIGTVYTVEFSFYIIPQTLPATIQLSSLSSSVIQITNAGTGLVDMNITSYGVNSATSISTRTWHDFAMNNDGQNGRVFIDGVLKNTLSGFQLTPDQIVQPGFAVLGNLRTIGQTASNIMVTNVRVTYGFSRYGANYTPRTTQFPNTGP